MVAKPWPPIFIANLSCGLGLALAFWVTNTVCSINLVTDTSLTLFIIWLIELPIVTLLYSRCRKNPQQCTYLRAVRRGILAVPVGALLTSLLAISLGAPVTSHYLPMTVNWSIMISLFTIVPTSCVIGSSWAEWIRIFAYLKSDGIVEDLLCVQASCVALGGWYGFLSRRLNFERPWQEWPISITYGASGGYLVGLVFSLAFAFFDRRLHHVKTE